MVYEQNHIDLPTLEGVYTQLCAYGNYIDEVVYASCPGATYTMRRYLHDHLYSPAAIVYLTASNCIVVERSEYDAYGVAHYYNADYSQTFAISQHGNPFAFTGREIDSFDFVSGVPQLTQMHYRHRDYSPFMGRFYQQDPLRYKDGLNLYEYVGNKPLRMLDPFGLVKFDNKTCFCGSSNWNTKQMRDKFRKIQESMNKSCDNVDSYNITDKKLADCIKGLCKKKTVYCGSFKRKRGGDSDWFGTVTIYPDYFNPDGTYTDNAGATHSAGDLLIHEYAHSCGWKHVQDNKGIPAMGDDIQVENN